MKGISKQPLSDPDLDYMTPAELSTFRNMRKCGQISFFRAGKCLRCETEIHNAKQYCSKRCKTGEEDNGSEGEQMD